MKIKTLGNGFFFFPDYKIIVSRNFEIVSKDVENAYLCNYEGAENFCCARFKLFSNTTRGIVGKEVKRFEWWYFSAAEAAENQMFKDDAIAIVRNGESFFDNYQNGKELSYSAAYLLVRYRQIQNYLAKKYKDIISLRKSLEDIKNATNKSEKELKQLEEAKKLDKNFIRNILSNEKSFKKAEELIENFVLNQMAEIQKLKQNNIKLAGFYNCVANEIEIEKNNAIINMLTCFSAEKKRKIFSNFKMQVENIVKEAAIGTKDAKEIIEEFEKKCENKFV